MFGFLACVAEKDTLLHGLGTCVKLVVTEYAHIACQRLGLGVINAITVY